MTTRVVNTSYLPAGGGTVTASVTFSTRGYNTIRVEARDEAGNTSTASVRVCVSP